MSIKSDMIATFTQAQQAITRGLTALETADDNSHGRMPDDAGPFAGVATADAQIAAREAYHLLKAIAYPPSTDPLDAITANLD